ncbi:hypothetical protein D9611_013793 [Ephemerocybe angulata]|uniref:Enoyl reductase (ER) domain-containing protein n=1 Tax=Ephemerocybe angulata TaxID=980116 RepID=A0A8H5C4S6_9AGAR|nr:hypothetical protein D9611_013793 [Tulosesus angulatus]
MSTSTDLPKVSRAVVVAEATDSSPKRERYPYDAALVESAIPELKPGQVLLKINAAGFNHKDVWIRKGLYPGIVVGSPYGGDGAGVVIASATPDDPLLNKRVFLSAGVGWKSHPDVPEKPLDAFGGTKMGGTFIEYVAVDRDLLIPSPEHLDDVHVAAWPLGGVTAWRAAIINAKVKPGQNILITGIGGGVALLAMQFCLATGANVYVTSGKQEKIDKAIELGAKGGFNYKDDKWPELLGELLKKEKEGSELDAVIDSGGGPILSQVRPYLKYSGRFVCYGMTAYQEIPITMSEVLKNFKFLGSTLGSQKDLEDATDFINKHRIVPIISHVLEGLESAEEGFTLLDSRDQFGKVIIRLGESNPNAAA